MLQTEELDRDQADLDGWALVEEEDLERREALTVEDTVDVLARARAEGEAEQLVGIERCARCGCTDLTPCAEGCGWAAPELCTNCAADELI